MNESIWDLHRQSLPTRAVPVPARRRRVPVLFATALMALAVLAAYMVAVVALRLQPLFLPGHALSLPAAVRALPGIPAAQAGDAIAGPGSGRITVLVLGLDRRPSEGKEPTRSDSMFVLSLDPSANAAAVLSIPRDLWLELPDGSGGYFEDRINTAYRYGGLAGYRGGGMAAARDAIEHNFPQIHIDYTAAIDFNSFIQTIDLLGGVDVTVTEAFRYSEAVSVDDRDGVLPEFRPGVEHMNGVRALYYSRYRGGPDGDLGRIRRQQGVMIAVANRLTSTKGWDRAPALWSRLRDAVETDVPSYRVPGLALLVKGIGLQGATLRSLGEVTHQEVTAGGAEVLVADPDDLARVVNELFADPRLGREAATVEVQNGTSRAGLARATAGELVRHGLGASSVAVSSVTPGRTVDTSITVYGDHTYTAARVAEWLAVPVARVRSLPDADRPPGGPDIVVVLGRDAATPASTESGLSRR